MFSPEERRRFRFQLASSCRSVAGVVLFACAANAAVADNGTKALLERALAAETESLAILLDHHRLEEDLLSPDVDRLGVFLTLPPGLAAEVEQVQLLVDASSHNPALALPKSRLPLTVPLFVQRVGPGAHSVRLDLRLAGSRGVISQSVSVDKPAGARFVEFRLQGGRSPQLSVVQW
ncbi:MAG TPA: hypothetical protein VIS73_12370 [Rhodocyclaceae bacterium]